MKQILTAVYSGIIQLNANPRFENLLFTVAVEYPQHPGKGLLNCEEAARVSYDKE